MGLVAKLFGGRGWRAKDYARKVKGWWIITPDLFFPAMIQHIQATLEDDELPAELVDLRISPEIDPCLAARRYRNWARRIPERAWSDALVPLADMPLDFKRLTQRAEALECARLWFTRALKNMETPICIRILKDERFRLGTTQQFRA